MSIFKLHGEKDKLFLLKKNSKPCSQLSYTLEASKKGILRKGKKSLWVMVNSEIEIYIYSKIIVEKNLVQIK